MFFPWSPMDISFYQQLQLSPPSSSSPKHPALCYYPGYPSPPFATDDGFGNHIPEAHTAIMTDNPWPPPPPPPPPKVDGGERVVVARKDKHSKICTAGGMRDRRMRLSLDVARRFFALQDKLGFDKASKTVQWLLHMSRAGIKELMVSEDGSSLSDTTKQHDEQQITMDSDSDKKNKRRPIKALIKRAANRKQATRRPSNAASSPISIDKESRARARERARERTKERNRLRWATLASSISIEEAPSSRHLNMASQVEDAIPSSEHHSSYYHQDQWELSGVVFAKTRSLPLIE